MDNRLLMSDEQIAGLVIDSRPPRVASRHVELGTMHVKTCIAHLEAIEQRSELDQDVVGHRRVVVPIQPEQGEAIDSYVLLYPPEGPPPLFAGHAPRLPARVAAAHAEVPSCHAETRFSGRRVVARLWPSKASKPT